MRKTGTVKTNSGDIKAVWTNPPFGTISSPSAPDIGQIGVFSENLPEPGIKYLGTGCCIVSEVRDALAQTISGVAGVCGNCLAGLVRIESLLSSIIDGQSGEDAVDVLSELAEDLVTPEHCPPVSGILGLLLSSLQFFGRSTKHTYSHGTARRGSVKGLFLPRARMPARRVSTFRDIWR